VLKFQKYRFGLAHVDEVDLVLGNGCSVALNTKENEYDKDDG
jgi:hypothetical protein